VLILDRNGNSCASAPCNTLAEVLRRDLAVHCRTVGGADELSSAAAFNPKLIILRTEGIDSPNPLVGLCRQKWPDTPILLLICPARGYRPDIQMLAGCDDFSYCPFHQEELVNRVRILLQMFAGSAMDNQSLCAKEILHFGALVGTSEKFLAAIRAIPPMAESDATILMSGQTGTGKELFSRAIHYQSRRQRHPFIPVNCAALPDHLFENELFGHVKGAYTDATSAEKGLIAEAEGGTLVLDEIDALSLVAQAKLLRFLQDREYRPVGSARSVRADVRVIASTNADLLQRVEASQFREDLYYRLNSLSLPLPALRERMEDVVPLTAHILDRFAKENGRPVAVLTPSAMDKLMDYTWPGNVRELESIMTRALTFSRAPILKAEDIQLPSVPAGEPAGARSLREAKIMTVENFERRYLATLLIQHQGNVTHAARAAGKERRAFQRLLRRHHLDRQSFVSEPR
jgi:DNA-binding NtrC family response regulator